VGKINLFSTSRLVANRINSDNFTGFDGKIRYKNAIATYQQLFTQELSTHQRRQTLQQLERQQLEDYFIFHRKRC